MSRLASPNELLEQMDPDGAAIIAHAIAFEGYTFKDFMEISDEQMEAVYAYAFNLVDQSRWAEAEKLLTWLASLDQFQAKYLVGLGICRQQLKEYTGAIAAFATAGLLDVENPIPALRAAECYLAIGQIDEAQSGVKAALHWAADKAEHEAVRSRAAILQVAIDRRRESQS
jgi:type III secretion system low calcium response chaperone LcrH/SycD